MASGGGGGLPQAFARGAAAVQRFRRARRLVVWCQCRRRARAARAALRGLRLERRNLAGVASERDELKARLAAMEVAEGVGAFAWVVKKKGK